MRYVLTVDIAGKADMSRLQQWLAEIDGRLSRMQAGIAAQVERLGLGPGEADAAARIALEQSQGQLARMRRQREMLARELEARRHEEH